MGKSLNRDDRLGAQPVRDSNFWQEYEINPWIFPLPLALVLWIAIRIAYLAVIS